MRRIPDGFDAGAVADIDACLDRLEREHEIRILWAIESGSRAWGFPSPDSDYDCRFIYVRDQARYLTLFPPRDVVEMPVGVVLDVNGWDIAKALKLMLKGNAVIIEWLTSPVVYTGDVAARDAMLELARRVLDRNAVASHYLHLGSSQLARWRDGGQPFKKLFYALRPALSLRWLRLNVADAVAPMNIEALMRQVALDPMLNERIERMIVLKAQTREMGLSAHESEIVDFCEAEFAAASAWIGDKARLDQQAEQAVDSLFRDFVARYGGSKSTSVSRP